MQTKLFVGNLSYNATEEDLKEFFSKCGNVQSAEIVKDRYSGQSKGFAFVVMGTPEEAEKACQLNGTELLGRGLSVSEARPPKPRGEGGFGGGGRRDGGNSRGGGRRGY